MVQINTIARSIVQFFNPLIPLAVSFGSNCHTPIQTLPHHSLSLYLSILSPGNSIDSNWAGLADTGHLLRFEHFCTFLQYSRF